MLLRFSFDRVKYLKFCAFCWGLSLGLPSTSIPLSNIFGITLAHFLMFATLTAVLSRLRSFHLLCWMALVSPALISTLFIPTIDAGLTLKYLGDLVIATLPLLFTMVLALSFGLEILKGSAVIILVNVAFGFYQMLCGVLGRTFDLGFLYNYPQYNFTANGLQAMCDTFRPFGLFPEPSATNAALSPWILLLLALGFGLIKFKQSLVDEECLRMFKVAGLLGVLLVFFSKSGHTIFLLFGLSGIFILLVKKYVRQRRWSLLTLTLAVIPLIVVVGLYLTSQRIESQFDPAGVGNNSWSKRFNAIMDSVDIWLNYGFLRIFFGCGGDAARIVFAEKGSDAIWSVLMTHVVNTGICGLLFILGVFVAGLNAIKRSGVVLVGFVFFSVWLLGITFTTCYQSLTAVWASLGWLLVWDKCVKRSDEVAC